MKTGCHSLPAVKASAALSLTNPGPASFTAGRRVRPTDWPQAGLPWEQQRQRPPAPQRSPAHASLISQKTPFTVAGIDTSILQAAWMKLGVHQAFGRENADKGHGERDCVPGLDDPPRGLRFHTGGGAGAKGLRVSTGGFQERRSRYLFCPC